MATREITKRRSGGKGKEIVSGWSRRFLKLRWRREEVKPCFSLWKARWGVLSWVRLGPASVRLFLEGLDQCVKNGKEDKWEKGWKKKGRSYSMVRKANKVGCFIRLGVVDVKEKRYSICILKGRGEKGEWSVMAEIVRDLIASLDRKEKKKSRSL